MTDEHATRRLTALPPLSLYVHLPWCVRKCPYCDFNSHEARGEVPEEAYVDALLADLATELPAIWGRNLVSVFIGGGTPSLFSARALDRLLGGVRALTALAPNVEVTMEANPGTVERARFADYRALGINRLSLGVQSFDDAALAALGRIHSGDEAHRAIDVARAAGFDEMNLDLMYALPGQGIDAALADLDAALAHAPEHLSCYELTLEPNTLFARFPPELPDDDARWDIQTALAGRLVGAGFERYEISAWARPGHASVHNTNYWRFGDYVGIGAGAHGKISRADDDSITRRWKTKHPARYLELAGTPAGGRRRIGDPRRGQRARVRDERVPARRGVRDPAVRAPHRRAHHPLERSDRVRGGGGAPRTRRPDAARDVTRTRLPERSAAALHGARRAPAGRTDPPLPGDSAARRASARLTCRARARGSRSTGMSGRYARTARPARGVSRSRPARRTRRRSARGGAGPTIGVV